jgi:hypothetical protein
MNSLPSLCQSDSKNCQLWQLAFQEFIQKHGADFEVSNVFSQQDQISLLEHIVQNILENAWSKEGDSSNIVVEMAIKSAKIITRIRKWLEALYNDKFCLKLVCQQLLSI